MNRLEASLRRSMPPIRAIPFPCPRTAASSPGAAFTGLRMSTCWRIHGRCIGAAANRGKGAAYRALISHANLHEAASAISSGGRTCSTITHRTGGLMREAGYAMRIARVGSLLSARSGSRWIKGQRWKT